MLKISADGYRASNPNMYDRSPRLYLAMHPRLDLPIPRRKTWYPIARLAQSFKSYTLRIFSKVRHPRNLALTFLAHGWSLVLSGVRYFAVPDLSP